MTLHLTLTPTEQFFEAGDIMVRMWQGKARHDDGSETEAIAMITAVAFPGQAEAVSEGLCAIPPPDRADAERWGAHDPARQSGLVMPLLNDDPGYWMYETSGRLRPAVEAYLNRQLMSEAQIAAMRAYLRQWIAAPTWRGPDIQTLRERIDGLTSRGAIRRWLDLAEEIGIDPL